MKYTLKIREVNTKGIAFFECSNGDFGYLEPLRCEIEKGDDVSLEGTIGCGIKNVILNGKVNGKVTISCLNSKEAAYKEFKSISQN